MFETVGNEWSFSRNPPTKKSCKRHPGGDWIWFWVCVCVWPKPLDPGLSQDRVDATMPEKLLWTTLDRKHWSYDWAKVSGGLGWNLFQPKGSFLRKLGRWSKEAKGVWRQKSCAGLYTFCDLFRAIFYLFVAENPTFSWFTEQLKPACIWKITQYIYYWMDNLRRNEFILEKNIFPPFRYQLSWIHLNSKWASYTPEN